MSNINIEPSNLIEAVKNTILPGHINLLKMAGQHNLASILKSGTANHYDNVRFSMDNLIIYIKVSNDMNVFEIKKHAPDLAEIIQTNFRSFVKGDKDKKPFDVTFILMNPDAKKKDTWTTSLLNHSTLCLMTSEQKAHVTRQAVLKNIQVSDYLRELIKIDMETEKMKKTNLKQTKIPGLGMDLNTQDLLEKTYMTIKKKTNHDVNLMRNMVDMRVQEQSQKSIAKALGTHQPVVSRYLKVFGHTYNSLKKAKLKTA